MFVKPLHQVVVLVAAATCCQHITVRLRTDVGHARHHASNCLHAVQPPQFQSLLQLKLLLHHLLQLLPYPTLHSNKQHQTLVAFHQQCCVGQTRHPRPSLLHATSLETQQTPLVGVLGCVLVLAKFSYTPIYYMVACDYYDPQKTPTPQHTNRSTRTKLCKLPSGARGSPFGDIQLQATSKN